MACSLPAQRKKLFARGQLLVLVLLSILIPLQLQARGKELSKECMEAQWPITVGGRRDDIAKCSVYDPSTDLIIIAGSTRSSDFGPANSIHAFALAVTLNGDWTWGHYFHNGTEPLREITGCHLSPSQSSQLVFLGRTNQQAVMGLLNTTTGSISNLYSLANTADDWSRERYSTFETHHAVLMDPRDPSDSKPYLYSAFAMNDRVQLAKVLAAVPDRSHEFPRVSFHYRFNNVTADTSAAAFAVRMVPQSLFALGSGEQQQTSRSDSVFLSGTYNGVGSVMKFYKRNGALRWAVALEAMTSVHAVAERVGATRQQFFGCGENSLSERGVAASQRAAESEAWLFNMDLDGKMRWMMKAQGQRAGTLLSDACYGISYNQRTERITVVLRTDSPQFRVDSRDRQFDVMLMEINTAGQVRKTIAFSLQGRDFDFVVQPGALYKLHGEDSLVLTAAMYGYETKWQSKLMRDDSERNLDLIVMPVGFEDPPIRGCVRLDKKRVSEVEPFLTLYGGSQAKDLFKYSKDTNQVVPRSQIFGDELHVYYSKFAKERPLRSFVNTPRPCAYQSVILQDNPLEYFRASKTLSYNVLEQSPYGFLSTQIEYGGGTTQVLNKQGKPSDQATYEPKNGGEITFFSNNVRKMGLNEVVIRHCDPLDRLYELKLQVDVRPNSQPAFVSQLQTKFSLRVGQQLYYTLPDTVDLEGNAKSEILIEPLADYEAFFPPFIHLYYGNRTIEFAVDKAEYADKQYFFKIVLKEEGPDAIGLPYYVQVVVQQQAEEKASFFTQMLAKFQTFDQFQASGARTASNTPITTSEDGITTTDEVNEELNQTIEEDFGAGINVIGVYDGIVLDTTGDEDPETTFMIAEIYTSDLFGRTQLHFLEQADMTAIESDFTVMFPQVFVQKSDYYFNPLNISLIEFTTTNFNQSNQTVDVQMKFEDPFDLGLNVLSSDRIVLYLNQSYPWTNVLADYETIPGNLTLQKRVRGRIELTFDYENSFMDGVNTLTKVLYWFFVSLIALQILMLTCKRVGLLTFWVLIEYVQLAAFLPLLSARLKTYVYQVFRPFLISHLILVYPGQPQERSQDLDQYFTHSYLAFNLTKEQLLYESYKPWAIVFAAIVTVDILICLLRCCCGGKETHRDKVNGRKYGRAFSMKKQGVGSNLAYLHQDFRWNIYLRFLMIAYFDAVFIAAMIVFSVDREDFISAQTIGALLVLCIAMFTPIFVSLFVASMYDKIQDKTFRKSFNSLLLKVDKTTRLRLCLPAFFFMRRLLTAILLVLAALEIAPSYLQFFLMMVMSSLNLFFLGRFEPYVSRRLNVYSGIMEMLYFLLVMCMFFFTDATADIEFKTFAAYVSLAIIVCFIVFNSIVAIKFALEGRDQIKRRDRGFKKYRREILQNRIDEVRQKKAKSKRRQEELKERQRVLRGKQLKEKQKKLWAMGKTKEEIDEILKEEPVPRNQYGFGAVMGKRLVDYGIMSATTSSDEFEDQMSDEDRKPEAPFFGGGSGTLVQSGSLHTDDIDDGSENLETWNLATDRKLITTAMGPTENSFSDAAARSGPFRRVGTPYPSQMEANDVTSLINATVKRPLMASQYDNNVDDDDYDDAPPTARGLLQEHDDEDDPCFLTGRSLAKAATPSSGKKATGNIQRKLTVPHLPIEARDSQLSSMSRNLQSISSHARGRRTAIVSASGPDTPVRNASQREVALLPTELLYNTRQNITPNSSGQREFSKSRFQ